MSLLGASAIAGCAQVESLIAPRADAWERWRNHDPDSTARVDFDPWAEFLSRYVAIMPDGSNLVRYGAVSEPDRITLERFVARMGRVRVGSLSPELQAAYWINLYNALTVRLILQHYPVTTILDIDISPSPLVDGPFGASLIVVDGTPVSLNDIQHRILRPIWRDPRMHYALANGSRGGPDLAPRPYQPEQLDKMLDLAARGFVNDPRGVSLEDGTVTVSRIYSWYRADFGQSLEDLKDHLRAFADADLGQRVRASDTLPANPFDWRLNGAPSTR